MRRDQQRLLDALDALDSIAKMITGHSEADFLADEVLCAAVAHRLTVVGEAIARIGPEIRRRRPLIPWADIVGLRNILVHEYFGIYWPLVWQTAAIDAPRLRLQLAETLVAEFPE
jgi:uncharacterized protein with HEPN domain